MWRNWVDGWYKLVQLIHLFVTILTANDQLVSLAVSAHTQTIGTLNVSLERLHLLLRLLLRPQLSRPRLLAQQPRLPLLPLQALLKPLALDSR